MRRLCLVLVLVLASSIHPVAHADDRLPIPDAAAQKEADRLVKEVFGKDIEAAKTR